MNKEILRIAVPAIVSNITTPLLGLVDTAITGHLGAAVYLGAIAVGGTMFSMVYWVMNFLRLSTSGLTAQACGAGDYDSTVAILRRGMCLALLIAATLVLLRNPLLQLLQLVIDADPETARLSAVYFGIVIFGAPAVMANYVLSGWMLGMQNSRVPMWMALITNVVNIAVSLVLVVGMDMKIEGVATGTVVAQYAGVLYGVLMLRRMVRHGGQRSSIDLSVWRYVKMNVDIMLRTACLAAVTVWFTKVGASMGAVVLAANALLMQLFILFSYFMDGFAFAGEALSGKYCGAGDYAGLRAVIRGLLKWGGAVVLLFTVVYIFGGEWIITLLTDDYGVRCAAIDYLWWAVAIPAAGVLAFVWDGVFIGLVWMRAMLVSMFAAACVFFVSYHPLVESIGNHGLWLAFILYLCTRGAVQTLIYLSNSE